MKHHSQRSKRPPSRTLVPRILAALTAGAVTLGTLPYAYADDVDDVVISSVTEDLILPRVNTDVVDSLDGSSATITIAGRAMARHRASLRSAPPAILPDGVSPTVHYTCNVIRKMSF